MDKKEKDDKKNGDDGNKNKNMSIKQCVAILNAAIRKDPRSRAGGC